MFRKQNIIKATIAGMIFSLGYALANVPEDSHVFEWEFFRETIGPVLFEIGVLFFISSFFFLGEDEETQIERLTMQLQQAQQSAGMGLAQSYFYNFLVKQQLFKNNFSELNLNYCLASNINAFKSIKHQ